MRGLILFAHGARDPLWARPFERVAARCRDLMPGRPVTLSFLEFMSPELADAGASMVAQGCTEVDVLPLFLGAGGHVRKDLPVMMAALREAHPAVQWHLQRAAGESDVLVEALAQVALQLPATGVEAGA